MPSLTALADFKFNFARIGSEDQSIAEGNAPLDDLPIPDNEPEPLPEEITAPVDVDVEVDAGEFDLDSLFSSPDGELPPLDLDSPLGDDSQATVDDDQPLEDAAASGDDFFNFDSFGDLTGGAVDEISPDASADVPVDTFIDILTDTDLDVSPVPEPETETPPQVDDFDLDIEEAADVPMAADNISDSDVSDSSASADISDDDDFGIQDISFSVDDISQGEPDSFDNFNMDTDVINTDFDINVNRDLTRDEIDKDIAELDGLGLHDIDIGSGESHARTHDDMDVQAFGGVQEEEIEEIQLSDEELEQLQDTLLSYPLNLRIACEQLIVEEAVPPNLMSSLIRLLVDGASAIETASLAGKILGKTISLPKVAEKKTGAELEEEQSSFYYIFIHRFLPVLKLYMFITLVLVSLGYLAYRFFYIPSKAEALYKLGYERIEAGEYNWANRRFQEAFAIHPKKIWFYRYAEAFRDERQYIEAERKYQELLVYTAARNRNGLPDKKAVLAYAELATYYTKDYQTADMLLKKHILEYSMWDREALLALGDNNLAWGEIDPARYEDARDAYVKIIERYGQTDPVLERMLVYFIRTDGLSDVLYLQDHFMSSEKSRISASTLSELGGYLIDKRTEPVIGVPNEFRDNIHGIREVLLRAIRLDQLLPEPYYHLARFYEFLGSVRDEAIVLERALRVFEVAREDSPRRLSYNINAIRRYAEILINRREFFPAEEHLIRGINLYENGLSRRVLTRSPEFGKLYASMGDLEYFVKSGDMNSVIEYYTQAELSGYGSPELNYRMGSAYYQLNRYPEALARFVDSSRELPLNRRILHALGNTSYLRGNYHSAQGYFEKLLEMLEADRLRFPPIAPTLDHERLELAERIMVTQNNLGVVLEALAAQTGASHYRTRAMGLYSESERAWDVVTRDPLTMIRMRPSSDINAPGVNPAYLNIRNSLRQVSDYEPNFFLRIDRDILEPSAWENLAPPAFRLSEGVLTSLD